MTSLDAQAGHGRLTASPPLRGLMRRAPAIYAATLFLSALLVFAVQPMFTKMVLPRLGGSPSVWSVAMVSFQAFLFVGYVYAHVLARTLSPSRAALVHLGLLALAAFTLPLGIAAGFGAPPADHVMPWLVALFAASVGLPFVALSATAPLLQSWFVATGHPQAGNPYVLYAASNLGSFAALIAYPFAIEPHLALATQSLVWSAGFCMLALAVAGAACLAVRGGATAGPAPEAAPVTAARRAHWTLLAAVPSGLCIAVTSFITTDLAAAPFLWVVPLSLYLLTFVAVFRDRPWFTHAIVLRLLPFILAPLAISILGGDKVHWITIVLLNLFAFALIALACHGEAYRLRPEAGRLTEFYLWMSFGGMTGGIFAGLAAPHLFSNVYEYPVLIVAALLVLPGVFDGGVRHALRQAAVPLALAALAAALWFATDVRLPLSAELPMRVVLVAVAAAMLLQTRRPARYAGLAVLAFVLTGLWKPGLRAVETARSFFGVHQVVETADGMHRILFHGTTIHGAQRVRPEPGVTLPARPEPVTYYYFGGPLSETVEAARLAQGGTIGRVAAVGLGTGSMACHARDGEKWTFFEIDLEVIRIARDPASFRFLSACAPDAPIVAGDARLTLAAQPGRYGLIVLDAFSSDAIPVHLLTREAVDGYLSRLEPGGMIAMHISNRHMELASVVAAVAASHGLVAYWKQDDQANDFVGDLRANAKVAVLARSEADLGDLPQRPGWRKLEPRPGVAVWTDDYSDILRAILRMKLGG